MKLNEKGQCCGRKPLLYKRPMGEILGPHKFCFRCDRAFDVETGEQIENWAYKKHANGEFIKT
jgi:hypothetical protein